MTGGQLNIGRSQVSDYCIVATMPDTNTMGHQGQIHAPLRGERVVIVGAGRVGRSLCHWLHARGARIEALAGRKKPADLDQALADHHSDEENPPLDGPAPDDGAPPIAWEALEDLRSDRATLLILAVSDPALEEVAQALAARPQAPIALHVSGHFDANAIGALREAGCAVGSWHPLRAFTAPSADPGDAAEVAFAIDGDRSAVDMARRLTAALSGHAVEVSGEERKLYHLAASLAAGGVVTVLAAVDHLRRRAGLPDTLINSYLHLTQGAIAQVPTAPPIIQGAIAQAITGPAARRDHAMLTRQKSAVATLAPELLPLIESLAGATQMLRAQASLPGDETGAEAAAAPPNHR